MIDETQNQPMRLTFNSDPVAVRSALAQVKTGMAARNLPPEHMVTMEIVLAEVFNNIVEHAYQERPDGVIELLLQDARDGINCDIRDQGLPMPDMALPMGREANLNCAIADLPEGGFGWFMIRDLTQHLTYSRIGDCNHLSFQMPV